ncbi:MAG TPA: hypothetical protein VK955_03850 [Xanthobacteraceae bacterium]|nr:hypothetical protein [Xanthobacteraceae bacterium]
MPVLENDAGVSPKMALAPDLTPKLDAAKLAAPKPEASKPEAPKPEAAKPQAPEMPKIAAPASDIPRIEIHAPAAAPRKAELASVEAPRIAPDVDEPKPAAPQAEAGAGDAGTAPAAEGTGPRVSRFTLLAASLALAAALGGMAGALAAYGLARPAPLPAVAAGRTNLDEIQALKENVVQARVELAALKVSIDSANRNANAQFTRIGERIERIERVQAEPATKLNKAVEMLDRISRGDSGPQPKEVTGSLAPPPASANGQSQPPKSGVEGWVVRDVHRGTALIEGRMGIIEVEQGDLVPGLGRVDAIRKQDGRWVVVTSRGLITSGR